MPTAIPVVLIHRNEVERLQIRQVMEAIPGVQIAGERPDLRAGIVLAHQVRPAILVLELGNQPDDALQAASQYRLDNPDVAIVFAAESVTPDLLMRAMRAGAQEVLRRPLDRGALSEAVERVARLLERKQGSSVQRSTVTVFSSKGGVGVSTVAVNLALALRRRTSRDVAVVDFDNQSGDVASMLGVLPLQSLGDLSGVDRIDSALLQGVMTRHASGLMVLPQPERLDQVESLTSHQAGGVLESLGAMYETVVIDAPHTMSDLSLEIFDRSSTLLVLVEPSILSVRAARRSIDLFHKLNYLGVPDRVRLVVNRRTDKSAVSAQQIEDTLGLPISFSVANDYAAVSESINLGRPLCLNAPTSRAGKDIEAIGARLVRGDEPVEAMAAPATPRRKLRLFGKG